MLGAKFLGRLFGTEKALEGIVDGATKALDKLAYTEEEKEQDAAKERSEARQLVVQWMGSTQGQNLARRMLALIVSLIWVTMYLISTLLDAVRPWVSDPDISSRLQESASEIGDRAMQMNGAMMLILGFYFAAPHMGQIVSAALQRFGKFKTADERRTG